jgi:hypothetical protein
LLGGAGRHRPEIGQQWRQQIDIEMRRATLRQIAAWKRQRTARLWT